MRGGHSDQAGFCRINEIGIGVDNYSLILAQYGWNYIYLHANRSLLQNHEVSWFVSDTDSLLYEYSNTECYILIARVYFVSDIGVAYIVQESHGVPQGYIGGYGGSFTVINDGVSIKVIDGLSLDNPDCGYTDLIGNIPIQTFLLADCLGKKIYLIGTSDGTTYTVTIYIEGNEPAATYKSRPYLLATIAADGTVTQNWTGGYILFGDSYFI